MAAFLRKKATLSRKKPEQSSFISPPPALSSSDAPPSLPPLLLSTSLADPEPTARAPPALPPAASPPVTSVPEPEPEHLALHDLWDPWKAYASSPPRLDSTPDKPTTVASNASVHAPNICNVPQSHPTRVVTASSPRHTISARQVLRDAHPKSEALGNHYPSKKQKSSPRPSTSPPAVLRGQVPPSNFDFEESLSAANVTSVVNQSRSYPPPTTSPAPPSQMATHHPIPSNAHRHHSSPQKPGSSSSLSSSSHNTDATRRTNGSYATSTSASSLSNPAEVIPLGGRLDPVSSPFSSSHPALANGLSRSVGLSRASTFVDSKFLQPAAPHTSRPFTSSNASSRANRSAPSAPPTSYPERAQTLVRNPSHSNPSSSSPQQPMLYDMLRAGNAEIPKGPLIFSTMAAPPHPTKSSPSKRNANIHNPYPSPPVEYASLEASSPPHRSSVTSSTLRSSQTQQGLSINTNERPSLSHKSSKSSLARVAVERAPSVTRGDISSDHSRPRVLTKYRPSTPQRPSTSPSYKVLPIPGDPLLLDEDPFACVGGVKVVKQRARSSSTVSSSPPSVHTSKEDGISSEDGHIPPVPKAPLTPQSSNDVAVPDPEKSLPTPVTPDDYKTARQQRRGQWLEKVPPPAVAEVVAKQLVEEDEEEEPPREPTPPPTYFPILEFMSNANLLPVLLSYLSYSEWLPLYNANKQVREVFQSRMLREFVLERYLTTVGYSKWNYEWAEPLELSLKDLNNYLRGVAMPTHQYARLSAAYLQPKLAGGHTPMISDAPDILTLALTTRAYARVVLRLRAQAESEAKYLQTLQPAGPVKNNSRPGTRQASVSSRAPSPSSSYSHSRNHSRGMSEHSPTSSSSSMAISKFRSPLYRPGRAPVLRVFVPSPDGDWLSDASVVECEAELKRSGILKLLRVGDIVWDAAVGDEGNLGRLMWDGSYLVDLDYRYSRMGELSPYFHSLAFSPSYFHRVIRIGGSATHNPHCNPIVYIDVSPWGREIAAHLQLLQDRARTETPHGTLHDVVRWVHRSSFTIRPPMPSSQNARSRMLRVPIPNTDGFYIDPGWYGTVVLESEGTNEGLVDLQARCGPGVFPPRAETLATKMRNEKEKENRRVWRILREKSRPGEIWLRAVEIKERLM